MVFGEFNVKIVILKSKQILIIDLGFVRSFNHGS